MVAFRGGNLNGILDFRGFVFEKIFLVSNFEFFILILFELTYEIPISKNNLKFS